MFEIQRVLLNKNIILLLIITVLLNCVLFTLNCSENKLITLDGDELYNYIDNTYPEFSKNTEEQALKLDKITFSINKDSYWKKNIHKSRTDYNKLSDITLQYGENRGIVVFSNFHLTDIFFIGMLLMIAFTFAEESKKGLAFLVRSTANGRTRLSIYRLISLFIGAVILCSLFYGSNIIMTVINFSGTDFSRFVQSIPEFMRCPFRISIAEYMLFSVIIKCIAGFSIAVLFYFLTDIFGTLVTVVSYGAFSVASFLCYTLILPTSSLNIMKFVNFVTLVKTDDYFKEYCNLNILGNPVGILWGGGSILCFIIIVVIPLWVILRNFIHEKSNIDFLKSILDKTLSFFSRKAIHLPLFLLEGEKILIKQKGIVFIAICFYLVLSASLDYRYSYPVNPYELEWHNKFDGLITVELITEINTKYDELIKNIETCEVLLNEALVNGGPMERIQNLQLLISEFSNQKNGLYPVLSQANECFNYSINNKREVWLVEPYSYKLFLIDDKKTTQQNNIYMLIGIIGAIAGIMANENQFNMTLAIKSTKRGRWELLMLKMLWVFVITVVFAVLLHLIQFIQIGSAIEYNNMIAPVQSLDFLREFPFFITIRDYLIYSFGMRGGMAFLCGVFVSVISRLRKDRISVMGICVFLVVVPYVLFIFGEG